MDIEHPNNSFVSFSNADLGRARTETPIGQVEFHRELPSTNDLALEIADLEDVQYPLLVLAESQTTGRGRKTNTWWSDRGALTFSLLFQTSSELLPPNSWPQASLTTGLAVCEGLEEFLAESNVQLKWPNDVYIGNRKICGILVETPPLQKDKLIIGIGININNSFINAPKEITDSTTAMCDVAGEQFPLIDVLVGVINKVIHRISWVGSRDRDLHELWRKRCLLTNRFIHVEMVSEKLEGLCKGIDDEGALLLQTSTGIKQCFAGTITFLDE